MNRPVIFLIDDDADDQELFEIAIHRTGSDVNCVFANDGIEAIDKLLLTQQIPDMIFIDMNMPRMNGQQCLKEIKKIDHLKNIPVYMYSTSADPVLVRENISLGATDFITKPSDLNELSDKLKEIFKRHFNFALALIFSLFFFINSSAQNSDSLAEVKDLKKLSVEELMNLYVTSVSKSPEKLSEVASAVQVITADDIERSTVTRLPEALRLATNMQVAQIGAHDWGITSRGFNGSPVTGTSLANKLLVMIDGRSIYTPVFGGVFWDAQNVMLNDIDRIEVISGPGGSLWGANAVNGIVNIMTKEASQTQGIFASVAGGSLLSNYAGVRFGGKIDSSTHYRLYGQRYQYNNTTKMGKDAKDGWDLTQGGFRIDKLHGNNLFTVQGDLYSGTVDDTGSTFINGQNIIGRWTHDFSTTSQFIFQTYFDRTFRNISRQGWQNEIMTYDLDFQHGFSTGKRNKILYGLGYRLSSDEINSKLNDYRPAKEDLPLISGFVQDQFAVIPDKIELTVGTKIIHNYYTNYEFHPTIRVAYTPSVSNTIWASVSRAVRTPTRFDSDLVAPVLGSYGNFKSEKVNAYELGYRSQPFERLSFSASLFYNNYFDLRSVDTNLFDASPLYYFGNNLEANSFGIELFARYIMTDWLRIRTGYTFLQEDFTLKSAATYPYTDKFEALDPKNQFLFQFISDITNSIRFDGIFRFVDNLPQALDGSKIGAYATFDLRLGWNYKSLDISINGQNLAQKNHAEFGMKQIPRSVYAKIAMRF